LDPAALKAYAVSLQTPLSAARGEIAALTELDSTEFANLPNIDPQKAVASIQVCVKIANVRDTFGEPILALSHAVGSRLVPKFPEKIGSPSDYTFIQQTLMGLQKLTS
jgi:hypothetical protein